MGTDSSNQKKKHIAYIVSMPHGLDAWTYREIDTLSENDFTISIFPLRYASGPYMPKRGWTCYRYRKWLVIFRQFVMLAKSPSIYLSLVREAIRTRSIRDFLLGIDFAHQMVKRKVDMIHCVFGDHKLFIGYYCKKILDIPLSVALYGYELRVNPNWPMFRCAIKEADRVIVNCDFNKSLLTEIAGNELAQSVDVIRHYAEIPFDVNLNKISILIVGAFMERKGHDLLFQAVSTLGATSDSIEVWVAGYSGTVDVHQLAIDFGIEEKVNIFGSISDQCLDVLYRHCDIFCLPSKTDSKGVNEGLPVALIEAMAYAKPVVATRMAGIPELVEEILIDEGDVEGLSNALERLIGSPELRKKSGVKNREIVEARYSKQNVYSMRDIWNEVLDGGL